MENRRFNLPNFKSSEWFEIHLIFNTALSRPLSLMNPHHLQLHAWILRLVLFLCSSSFSSCSAPAVAVNITPIYCSAHCDEFLMLLNHSDARSANCLQHVTRFSWPARSIRMFLAPGPRTCTRAWKEQVRLGRNGKKNSDKLWLLIGLALSLSGIFSPLRNHDISAMSNK